MTPPLERPSCRQHFVYEATERPNIGAVIGIFALELLGCHVVQRAENRPRRRCRWRRLSDRRRRLRHGDSRRLELRESEIEQLHPALRQHHVRGLQIPMDDARAMRLIERAGDLNGDTEDLVKLEASTFQPLFKRVSLEMFEHQIGDAVMLADVEQRADVRMLQRRDGFRFTRKPSL